MPVTRSSSAAPKGQQSSPYADKRVVIAEPQRKVRRYGLRSMLSSLIWGATSKGDDDEESESGDEDQGIQLDGEEDDAVISAEVHPISDEDEEESEQQVKGFQRYDSIQKGKGRARDILKQTVMPASQTFGNLRSGKRSRYDDEDTFTSTPAQSPTKASAYAGQKRQRSPQDINSELANFFAGKGTAALSADERRHVADLLLRGSSTAATAGEGNIPTAYTPAFTFASPLPRKATSASILSPAPQRIPRSNTTLSNLAEAALPLPTSVYASRPILTGSQSLSGLASLAAAANNATSRLPSAANPRSAVARRAAARPLYLGAGHSSTAAARRRRAAASLFSNFDSFNRPAQAESTDDDGTPGKRRRIGGDCTSSSAYTVPNSISMSDYPSLPSTAQMPANLVPFPNTTNASPAGLFNTAPHLRAKVIAMSTPARPSPLRQAVAPSPSPQASPVSHEARSAADETSARPISRTLGIMKSIVNEMSQASPARTLTTSVDESSSTGPDSDAESRSIRRPVAHKQQPARVPREQLLKPQKQLSAEEYADRTVPPDLRAKGKVTRPKPPPLPSSARKTRAQTAADVQRRTEPSHKSPTEVVPKEASPGQQKATASEADATGPSMPMKPTPVQQSKHAEPTAANPVERAPATFSFSTAVADRPKQPTLNFGGFQVNASSPLNQTTSIAAPSAQIACDARTASSPPAPAVSFSTPINTADGARKAALALPAVSLPSFTLYESGFSLSDGLTGLDARIKAIRDTVLAMPARELQMFQLL